MSNTKQFILDHVLYEMEMYLFTFCATSDEQLFKNMIWVTKQTHMRNLLHFFSNNKDKKTDIIYKDILSNIDTLEIKNEDKSRSIYVINKSISHLTMNRIKDSKNNLDIEATEEIERMKPHLVEKIKKFLDELPNKINSKYKYELENPEIQCIISTVKLLLKNCE